MGFCRRPNWIGCLRVCRIKQRTWGAFRDLHSPLPLPAHNKGFLQHLSAQRGLGLRSSLRSRVVKVGSEGGQGWRSQEREVRPLPCSKGSGKAFQKQSNLDLGVKEWFLLGMYVLSVFWSS